MRRSDGNGHALCAVEVGVRVVCAAVGAVDVDTLQTRCTLDPDVAALARNADVSAVGVDVVHTVSILYNFDLKRRDAVGRRIAQLTVVDFADRCLV